MWVLLTSVKLRHAYIRGNDFRNLRSKDPLQLKGDLRGTPQDLTIQFVPKDSATITRSPLPPQGCFRAQHRRSTGWVVCACPLQYFQHLDLDMSGWTGRAEREIPGNNLVYYKQVMWTSGNSTVEAHTYYILSGFEKSNWHKRSIS